MRYRVQVLGWTLIWSGLFVFGFIGWQLVVTDWINAGVQAEAAVDLDESFDTSQPVREEVRIDRPDEDEEEPPEEPAETVEYFPETPVERGESFAFLTIPKIGLEDVVVYGGVDTDTLRSGPGHMGNTPLPGQPGNSVISGHRTTYGRPFFDFDLLEVGDEVEVETSAGVHVYEIREIIVVEPTDVWVTDHREGGWLTMTTCEPKFSARQRLVVFAEMISGPNLEFIEATEATPGL